jgi:hypothetical protein
MAPWKHDALASDLAAHLALTRDRVVFENMQLGPAGSPRPDVYSIPKVYSRFTPLAYEVKVSVADFRADLTAGKWQSYRAYAGAVIFAVPAGLITRNDIPEGCGLMVRNDDAWKTVKAPALKVVENLPLAAWQKLFFDGIERMEKARKCEPRASHPYHIRDKTAAMLGKNVAWALEHREKIDEAAKKVLRFVRLDCPHETKPPHELAWKIQDLAGEVERVMKLWSQIAALAGIEGSEWPDYASVAKVEQLIKSMTPGAPMADIADELDRISTTVARARERLGIAITTA